MYQKVIPFILATFLLICSTVSAYSNPGAIVCGNGTMKQNLKYLRAVEGYDVTDVAIVKDPRLIGPYLDREMQADRLPRDSMPLDAIYLIEILTPAKVLFLAVSYKGCYKGHKRISSNPFPTS